MQARFILSKLLLQQQVNKLKDLNLKISYSYKTNKVVGNLLQQTNPDIEFSIHTKGELQDIKDKSKIWFFTQAESKLQILELINQGIKNFVVDNQQDLEQILNTIKNTKTKINLSLRMKFMEHRIGTGKYFVYGMSSDKINQIIQQIKENSNINKIGIHIHRKSQNISEWEIKEELEDSLTEKTLQVISFINLGGGLPSKYRSYSIDVSEYIFKKIKKTIEYLKQHNIQTYIEPGRFLAAPCIKLETEIIQKYDNNLVINTTIYNCALDNILTGTKMLVEGEFEINLETNEKPKSISNSNEKSNSKPNSNIKPKSISNNTQTYLIKGNSPTRDDIFRYKVNLKEKQVGDKIVFLNAGAYNYTTDFFGYKKLETEITE